MSRVLVLGGRGFMGRRVVRLLKQTVTAEILTAGRSSANDRRLCVLTPEDDYGSLNGIDVVINTVGPFTYNPRPIVAACMDNGAHYVDLAETDDFVRSARAIGESASTAVVSGCSTVPGLIDVFAARWPERKIRAQLSIGTNNESSATLLFSMLRPIGRNRPTGARWFDHTWTREHPDLPPRRYGPYPGGGHEFAFGLDRKFYTSMLWFLSPLIAGMPDGLLMANARIGNALAPLLRPLGTKIGILSLDAIENGGVVDSLEIRARSNGLDVPAWPCVWATEQLLYNPRPATCLSELITPEQATEKLKAAGFEVMKPQAGLEGAA